MAPDERIRGWRSGEAADVSSRFDGRYAQALAELRDLSSHLPGNSRLETAVRIVSDALGTPLAKVLELEASGECFVVRAGVGWREGVAGQASVPATRRSSAGYALGQSNAVIFDDIQKTRRFTDATLLRSHGVTSGLAVRLVLDGRVVGVLSVHEQHPRQFTSREALFLETAAAFVAGLL